MQRVPLRGAPIKNAESSNAAGFSFGGGSAGKSSAKSTNTRSGGGSSGGGFRQSDDENAAPLVQLARRIRAEQGVEQLKEFLAAMTPFAAPGELKMAGERFGVSYESFSRSIDTGRNGRAVPEALRERESMPEQKHAFPQSGFQGTPNSQQQGMPPQMQMLKNLMMLQNLFGGGAQAAPSNNDPTALLRMLGSLKQQP